MSGSEMMMGGLKLMVCGMGTVFVFLVVMIYCMNLMTKVLAPYAAKFEPEEPKKQPAKRPADSDALKLAAAAVAVVEAERSR